MENEDILKKMVADEMVLTVVDPTDYSEVECHIEGGDGDYSLVSNDAQAPSDEELENMSIEEIIIDRITKLTVSY